MTNVLGLCRRRITLRMNRAILLVTLDVEHRLIFSFGNGLLDVVSILPSRVHVSVDVAKIDSVIEPVNFLLGKVGEPFIGDYVNNITSQSGNPRHARHAVVPDIHATNYPTGRQVVNDSGATRSADAIFEVKTYTFCPTRYNHNNQNMNPADRRARDIVNDYKRRVRNLDVTFASAVVGDGNNNVIGPFENTLSPFHGKTVIPLSFGAFGEVNKTRQSHAMFSMRSSIN